ncbi:MAG: GGDEF domain-containing protein [Tissierellia bacterium]|nr:GGDEF domain-containing protein [Tissierellia bacterium]
MKEFADYISDAFVHCRMSCYEGKFDIEAIYANKQLEQITNKTMNQLIGRKMTEVFPNLSDSIFDWPKILCEAAMTNEHTIIEQYINVFEKFVKFNIFGFKDDTFYIMIQDLTHKREIRRIILEKDRQIKHLENEVKSRASIEPLTNLYNFQFITDCLKHSIESYKDEGTAFCVLLIDIDDFKEFNLKHGMETGDMVLQDVAHILSLSARKIDVVGRYGNDKFIMILNNVELDIAKIVVEKVKMEISRYDLNISKNSIQVSGAVVEYRGETLEGFIEKAEELLEKAQAMGKGRILS